MTLLTTVVAARAAKPGMPPPLRVAVGPLSVDIRFQSQQLADQFSAAFRPVRADGRADYRLDVGAGGTGPSGPAFDDAAEDGAWFTAGAEFYAARFGARFGVPGGIVHQVDHATGQAVYWAGDAAAIPAWERARPFLASFQAMLAATGWLAVHAAAVAYRGRGVLLTGPGKAGKTSLSLAAAAAGWQFAGDDFVLVDSTTPYVAPLYATARLRADMAGHFPWARPAEAEHSADDGDLRHELRLRGIHIAGAPLAAILLLDRRGAAAPTFAPVSRSAVLAAMTAATAVTTPGYEQARATKLLRLLGHVTPLRFDPGPDFPAALAALRELLA